ncbi:MAG: hypothetical protein PHN42_04205 [Bacilli bacterium]|nr:hypothetical protein [Bacilli bacterium]
MKKYSYSVSEIYSNYDLNEKLNLLGLLNESENKQELRNLLTQFNIDSSVLDLDDTEVTIRLDYDDIFINLPLVSSKYYDENDQLFSKIKLNKDNTELLSFSGEIYEKLEFNDGNLKNFLIENNYQDYIYPESKAVIHFKGVEYNKTKLKEYYDMEKISRSNNSNSDKVNQILEIQKLKCEETKEMYIVKNNRSYMFYYNAPYIYDVMDNNPGFSIEEIDQVIRTISNLQKLSQQSEEDIFLLYATSALNQYEKTISNRGYKKEELLDSKAISVIEDCIIKNNKKENNIYFKLKIVANEEIKKLETKNEKILLRK